MDREELSAKARLLQSLLRCPHRELNEVEPVFREALERDPYFSSKALVAIALGTLSTPLEFLPPRYQDALRNIYPQKEPINKIRDLSEAACAVLLTSSYSEFRWAGKCLFQCFEPYRAYRIARFIRNDLRKVNRQVKHAVTDYIRHLESNKARFDRAVMVARKQIHHLYEFFHIKPSPRAQTIIFEGKVPEGEVDVVKLLRQARTPEEQAKVIVKYKVPYRLATSVLKGLTPAVWVALIEVMTPVEAVNLRSAIERSGILRDEKIRELYEKKLEAAKSVDRVSVAHLAERKSAKGTDERLEEIVQKARQEKIKKSAKITLDTLMCVDISGSMEEAVEVAKRLGPMVASICEAQLKIYCFNDVAFEVKVSGNTLQDFEEAFRMIQADGATCLGIPLKMCVNSGFIPEQVIYITDQGENRRPSLVEVYRELLEKGIDPRFIFVTLRGFDMTREVVKELESVGADVVDYTMRSLTRDTGWYMELDNVIPLLTKGGYLELVQKIMALELPS